MEIDTSTLKIPLHPPFFKGGKLQDGKEKEKSQVRHSKKFRFSVPLFEKEGPGEIFSDSEKARTNMFNYSCKAHR